MRKYYNEKIAFVKHLSALDTKKVTDSHVVSAAVTFKIPVAVAKRAWKNFQETGGKAVDKGYKGSNFSIKMRPTVTPQYTRQRGVKVSDAAGIIIEYMTTNIKIIELCNKHRITPAQFYNWINELQVRGTLLDKPVLNPKKYAKVNVLDVIRITKRPSTTKKSIKAMTDLERAAYERVGTVLQKYLSALAGV